MHPRGAAWSNLQRCHTIQQLCCALLPAPVLVECLSQATAVSIIPARSSLVIYTLGSLRACKLSETSSCQTIQATSEVQTRQDCTQIALSGKQTDGPNWAMAAGIVQGCSCVARPPKGRVQPGQIH